ncbi:zinc-dependent alcohol dehydrogenase family protein [Mariniluteicoccus endophyticus]
MRAVVYDAPGEMPEVREVPEPSCPPHGVVVEVAATGVCRSDWHAWCGREEIPLPHIPGHEFAGRVVEVGSEVRGDWPLGTRVTTPFVCGCGECVLCRNGAPQVCPDQTQPGFTGPGSFAERVVVHHADVNLVALPDDIDFVTAAALGCRFATAYRALLGHRMLRVGQWLLVLGAGGVGLSAVLIGRALGAEVVAVDVSADALARAEELGAYPLPWGDDIVERIREVSGGGVHLGLDALGRPDLAEASVRSLRRRGAHVQAGLLLGGDARTAFPMDLVVAHELAIFGTHGLAADDYPSMLALIRDQQVPLDRLIGRRITLDEAPQALVDLDRPTTGGLTVVVMDEG